MVSWNRKIWTCRLGDSHTAGAVLLRQPGADLAEFGGVASEDGIFVGAILQAGQIGGDFARRFLGQPVDHPIGLAIRLHQSAALQVGEMLGHFDLRLAEDRLQMAHAQRPLPEQVQDAQPGAVAETFVDADQFHAITMLREEYAASGILLNIRDGREHHPAGIAW